MILTVDQNKRGTGTETQMVSERQKREHGCQIFEGIWNMVVWKKRRQTDLTQITVTEAGPVWPSVCVCVWL